MKKSNRGRIRGMLHGRGHDASISLYYIEATYCLRPAIGTIVYAA
jgi:hypothetical protein